MAPYKTSGCPGTFSPPSHRRLQREAKQSQKVAEQFRPLHVFFYFNWMQCPHLCLSALFSHMINLRGPPSSLILKTTAPKKPPCSYTVKYYWSLPRPLRWHPEESRQALPCILYLYSTILNCKVTNPCCCNKHKGALTDGLTLSIPPVWLSDGRQWTQQQQNKYTHQIRGALNCLKTTCTWRGTVGSDAASEIAQEITELICSKASFPTET